MAPVTMGSGAMLVLNHKGEQVAGLPVAFREWDVIDRVILDQGVLPGHLGHVHELEFV
jgi:hypothetical protein